MSLRGYCRMLMKSTRFILRSRRKSRSKSLRWLSIWMMTMIYDYIVEIINMFFFSSESFNIVKYNSDICLFIIFIKNNFKNYLKVESCLNQDIALLAKFLWRWLYFNFFNLTVTRFLRRKNYLGRFFFFF